MIMTQRRLEAIAKRWQSALKLSDWEVIVKLTRAKNMTRQDSMGVCNHTLTKRIAYIEIMNPRDYTPDYLDHDIERTVVHELLHCHFAPFEAKTGTPEDMAQEQTIHAISTTLVELDRSKRS